jgi:peptidyl-prolyl cis-trans isomerase C
VRESVPAWARRLLAEPLLHFLIVGALIFVAASAVRANARPTLRISRQEIAQLSAYWQAQMQREPTKAELDGLVRERIDEEILAAEAKRLGMDQDDMIIRRRLAQKMAFATEDVSDAKEPTEDELVAWHRAHPDDYRTPAQVALRQVFFSGDRGDNAKTDAQTALAALNRGKPISGDPSVLPLTYADVSLDGLAKDFGDAFARAAATAPLGAWSGPVQSGFGWHLIRVERRAGAVTAPLAQVRGEVRDAVLAQHREEANAAYLAKLRKRYRVEVAAGPKP